MTTPNDEVIKIGSAYDDWLSGRAVQSAGFHCDAGSPVLLRERATDAVRYNGRVYGNDPVHSKQLRAACLRHNLEYVSLSAFHGNLYSIIRNPPDLGAKLRELKELAISDTDKRYLVHQHRRWVDYHKIAGKRCPLPSLRRFLTWVERCQKLQS